MIRPLLAWLPALALTVLAAPAAAQMEMALLGVRADVPAAAPSPAAPPVDDILARLGDDPAEYGARTADHDSGFSTYRDTPNFRNFTSFLGPNGDCAGISFVCRRLYLDIKWVKEGTNDHSVTREILTGVVANALNPLSDERKVIHGYESLREASKDPKIEDDLREAMMIGQLRNLNIAFLRILWPGNDWRGQLDKLTGLIDDGKPTLLALNSPPSLGGHMVVAYRVVEYEKKALVFIYDCNAGPRKDGDEASYQEGPKDATYKTVMVYDRASRRLAFHGRYKSFLSYDYDKFTVFQGPDWKRLPGRVISGVTNFFTDTVPSFIGGLFH